MRNVIVALFAAAVMSGAGYLYAQPAPTPPAPKNDLPDVTVAGEKQTTLSPREMASKAEELIAEMEAFHKAVLGDQAQAKQSKDVIKLNCVNENLLAVKQLLNIAEAAKNELQEAIAGSDVGEQTHQFGQITIAHEKASTARTEALNCIGEELHFIGKNDLQVDGPDVKHDPTDDRDVGQASGDDPFVVDLEDPGYASPFAPL